VAEYFMDEGYLGGPEFAGITAKRMPLLWGVEDMNAYDVNVAAVKDSALHRQAMDRFLQEAHRVMNVVKDRRLSGELLEFDRHLTTYHLGKEPLGDYVRYLLHSSPLSTTHVPNLVLLRDALHWEGALDYKRIESERSHLLERMVRGLSKQSLDQLVARSARYRLGRTSYGDYYRFLRSLCTQSGINIDEYAQLRAYVRYVLLVERINRNDLLTELSTLERAVQEGLTVSVDEKRIVEAARNVALMDRLVRHAYTPADWAYQAAHSEEIRNVGATIVALAQQTGIPHTLSPPSADTLKPFEDFCLQALGRNGAMVQNLLNKMKTEKRATAVLVAGGFHTEGLTQLLRQQDISYAVVTPKINGELPDGHRSLDLMARDPAPLEKLFAGETLNLPLARVMNTENQVRYGLVKKLTTFFVVLTVGLTAVGSKSEISTPPHFPPAISAVAAPVRGSSEAEIKVGSGKSKSSFFLQLPLGEGSSSAGSGIRVLLPRYGDVSVRRASPSMPWNPRAFLGWSGQMSVLFSQWKGQISPILKSKLIFGIGLSMVSLPASAALVSMSVFSVYLPVALLVFAGVGLYVVGVVLRTPLMRSLFSLWENLFSGIRRSFPPAYYTITGLFKTLAFPALGLAGISNLWGVAIGVVWAVPFFWLGFPIARAIRDGFSLKGAWQEILVEFRSLGQYKARSRLGEVLGLAGTFALAHALLGFYSAVAITAGISVLWDILRPWEGPLDRDPFRPSIMGYAVMIFLLITAPANKITIVSGDGDDFSAVNGILGKDLVGTVPGRARSEKIIFVKGDRSLFWERRHVLAELAWKAIKTRITRGVGGDEYFLTVKGIPEETEKGLPEVVNQFNRAGLIEVDEHDHPIQGKNPEVTRMRPREVFFSLPKNLSRGQVRVLKKADSAISLVEHAGRLHFAIDRKASSLSVEEIRREIEQKLRLEEEDVKEISWGAPNGVAVFTTSMGAVSMRDVVRVLAMGGHWYSYEKTKEQNRPDKLLEYEKEWIGRSGRVRLSKIPQLVLWGFRFANDALRVAKGEPLVKGEDEESPTRKQKTPLPIEEKKGKNRVYFLVWEDLLKMAKSKRVDWNKIDETRENWWKNLFRFGRSGVDSLSKTLTSEAFHAQISRENPSYLYRIDIARYVNDKNFFKARAFHEMQGNDYSFGNDLIRDISTALRETFSQSGVLSRTGPDSYYFATKERISHDQMEEALTLITKNLRKHSEMTWDPRVAFFEVTREGFDELNQERVEENAQVLPWPLRALAYLDSLSETVKVLGERLPIHSLKIKEFSDVLVGADFVRVTYPTTLITHEAFEEQIDWAETLVQYDSRIKLNGSANGKGVWRAETPSPTQEGKLSEMARRSGEGAPTDRWVGSSIVLLVVLPLSLTALWLLGHPTLQTEMLEWVGKIWGEWSGPILEFLGMGGMVGSVIPEKTGPRNSVRSPSGSEARQTKGRLSRFRSQVLGSGGLPSDLLARSETVPHLRQLLVGFYNHQGGDSRRTKHSALGLSALYEKVVKESVGEGRITVGYPIELAEAVAEWGGAEETIVAAFLGGMVIAQGIPHVPVEWQNKFSINEELFAVAKNLADRMVEGMRIPFGSGNPDPGRIRNHMGFLLKGILLKRDRDDQAVLLMTLANSFWLKYENRAEKRKTLSALVELVYAPLAARFGQDYLGTDQLDKALLSTDPDMYVARHQEFMKLTGLTHMAAQSSLEEFRQLLERGLRKKGGDFSQVKVYARVKSLASMHEKTIRNEQGIDGFWDLLGMSVVFPEGVRPDVHGVRETLRRFGNELDRATGIHHSSLRDYEFFRVVINAVSGMEPFKVEQEGAPQGSGQPFEIQIYSHDAWVKSKTGEAAHWLYDILKRLGFQVVKVDPVAITGDWEKDLEGFLDDDERKDFIYVMVRVPMANGDFDFVPIRLLKNAIPADAAAHRRINLLKADFNGMVRIFPSDKKMAEWEVQPLEDTAPLQSGMILAPSPVESGRPPAALGLHQAAAMVSGAAHRRTVLMSEIAFSRSHMPLKILSALADKGRAIVRGELARAGQRLEFLDSFETQNNWLLSSIRRIRTYFMDGKGVPGETEQNLLSPLAKEWGLQGPEEVFAYIASLNGREEQPKELTAVVSRLTDYHLEATCAVETRVVTVTGNYDRPGVDLLVIRALLDNGLRVVGDSSFEKINEGFRISYHLKKGKKPITFPQVEKALSAIRQIPDIPQRGVKVDLSIEIAGVPSDDLIYRLREALARAEITVKDFKSLDGKIEVVVSVPSGMEYAVEEILKSRFPEQEVTLSKMSRGLNETGVSAFALFGVDLVTPLFHRAASSLMSSQVLVSIFAKLGIHGSPPGVDWRPWEGAMGLLNLSRMEFRHVLRVAGFAVLPKSPHRESIKSILKEINLGRSYGIPNFNDRVYILHTPEEASTNENHNEFGFFFRDENGYLTIYVHENTLDEWERKGKGMGEGGKSYFRSALSILFYHEWAESFGVSHAELVKMGLTVEGLDALYASGLSETAIYWEIRARGMLALGMVVPDSRILNVDPRAEAQIVLESLVPADVPRDVQAYVNRHWQIRADRGTWARRTAYGLRSSIPGREKDSYSRAISGVPSNHYHDLLLKLGEGDADLLETAVRSETERLSMGNDNIREELARDILARVFQLLASRDWADFSVSGPVMRRIKKELAVLHHTGGSLFLFLSHIDQANQFISPEQRRFYQERDLAWLDQVPFLRNWLSTASPDHLAILNETSQGYVGMAQAARRMGGAFALLDETLFEKTITPVLRIPEELLVGKGPLTGSQRTALNEVTALARRAEQDHSVASRVVFLTDTLNGQAHSPQEVLRGIERRLEIASGSLESLATAHVLSNDNMFEQTEEKGRVLRTYKADLFFEKLKAIGISSPHVDIYSVPPTDSLAEVWDLAGMGGRPVVLRLIELWAGDVAVRVSSEFNEDFIKRMNAIRTAA
jgi:hypothetical protein